MQQRFANVWYLLIEKVVVVSDGCSFSHYYWLLS